ncbi:hypothetical protein [Edwardsiella tarda]|uniref:hypothetical protein n=1 Tax=Edwardsiella tarda TaxID=636 RepID=UPI00083A0AA9|nr:hypothetical protein [Edwardsiella tarda]
MALKVTVEKVLPFSGSSADPTGKVIQVLEGVGVVDAQVAGDRAAVKVMHDAVLEAHTHIHADRDQVRADKGVVAQDKATVRSDQTVVAADRKAVAADKAAVQTLRTEAQQARDQANSHKADALSYRNTAQQHAQTATTQANTSTNKATEATSQANRARDEANRAQRIADGINVNGGTVTGNLVVTGSITEGGTPLASKYATPAQLQALETKIIGGASGAYDTLREIEAYITSNNSQVGGILTTMNTKADKAAPRMTGDSQLTNGAYGSRVLPNGSASGDGYVYYQGGKTDQLATDQKMAFTGWMGTPLSNLDIRMTPNASPVIVWGSTKHALYHAGNKPTWNDIGGNSMFRVSSDHLIAQQNWLRTSSRGLVPATESATGTGSIGTAQWQFHSGYISNMYSRTVKIGEHNSNVQITKVGNRMVFSV